MSASSLPRALLGTALLLTGLAGCGPKDSGDRPAAEDPAGGAATPDEAAPAAAVPALPATQPLTVADIERWEKGVAGEMDAVRRAAEELKNARTGEDSLNAMAGLQEMVTVPAGARAAGLDQERYRFVRNTLSTAIAALSPPELDGMDTTRMPQAMRDEFRRGRESQLGEVKGVLPEDVLQRLGPRAAELRKRDLELVGARLKAAAGA